ncbi:MAG: tetratricopeptide repeat protein [Deltaproteobacteria bacterium]|nr:tetratricopeptide repeat protein [Deltaproteobacteria bacterium]
MFGRQPELRLLEQTYDAVIASGQARVVTLFGASGVGKSRIVQEILVRAKEIPGRAVPRVLRSTARPHGGAFDVLARLLRVRFDIPFGIHDDVAKERLREEVSSLLDDRKVGDVLYFLGPLLDLEFDKSPLIAAVADDPVQLKALRRAVLKRLIEAEAAGHATRGLLTIVLEDLHNAHDDSLEIIEYLAAHVQAPLMMVVTARPELLARRAGWTAIAGERHSTLEVGPLPDLDAQRMMEQLLAPVTASGGAAGAGDGDEIPQELIDAAVDMAGGNPALLEKMVRILHDSGVLTAEDMPTDDPDIHEERWHVNLDRLSAVSLPLNVQEAVSARLSALSPTERGMLERAAAMGAVFWLGGLVVLGRLGARAPEVWDPELGDESGAIKAVLDDLVARDYVLRMPDSTFPGEDEYVFKHNLEREALEKLIPAASSRHYHQTIADWLEFRIGVRSHEEHVAQLAWHREKAGATSRAALTWIEAGDIARARYANSKAAECYERGLELLGDDDARTRLSALHHYGDVLCLLGQYDAGLAQFNAMQALAYALDLKAKAGAAHNRIGRLYRESGRLEEATRHLHVGLQLFHLAGDERGVASSLDDIGKLAWMRGDYAAALDDMRKALTSRKRLGDRRSIALSLNNLGLVLQDSGHFKEALEAFEQSLRIRREIGDLVGVVTTLNNLGTVAQDQRDEPRAMALFQEALGIAREIGDRHKIVLVLTNIGETFYRTGDAQRAMDTLKESEILADEIGDRLLLAEAVRGLGKASLLRGDLLKAREYTTRALTLFEQVRSKVQIAVALRTLGEVTAAGGWGQDHVVKARQYFLRAIAMFEECGNEVELARTFRAYADFLRKVVEYQVDAALQAEAAAFDKRADDVFAKLRISAIGIDPGAFFS